MTNETYDFNTTTMPVFIKAICIEIQDDPMFNPFRATLESCIRHFEKDRSDMSAPELEDHNQRTLGILRTLVKIFVVGVRRAEQEYLKNVAMVDQVSGQGPAVNN